MSEVVNLRRPGQCCGLCLHLKPTGDERRWHRYVCGTITDRGGTPSALPVEVESGTHCRYFRARATPTPEPRLMECMARAHREGDAEIIPVIERMAREWDFPKRHQPTDAEARAEIQKHRPETREDMLPSGRCPSCHSRPGSCYCPAPSTPSPEPRAAAPEAPTMSEGVARIAAERQRQVEKEGWTTEHDDEHQDGEMAWAAVCYAAPKPVYRLSDVLRGYFDPWPWSVTWDKRPRATTGSLQTPAERIRMLEKAGALIAAEIDRLLRAPATENEETSR